jgi:hypothetical protein
VFEHADEASGSRLGRSPTAQRPKGLDADGVRRILFRVVGDELVVHLEDVVGGREWWTWLASAPVLSGRAGGWLLGHPFAMTRVLSRAA